MRGRPMLFNVCTHNAFAPLLLKFAQCHFSAI
jgi:hypothetical protein